VANKPISVTIKGDYSDRDIKRAIRDLESLQTQAPKTTRAMAGLSKAMVGLGAVLSAGAIARGIQSTISAASDLVEAQSKVGVVFGRSALDIEKWAETSNRSMVMSKQAALEAAGTYGNLFQAFGIGQTKATEMSKTLVQLAADLASFNNTSVDEAITALRSGLSGETEPLKRYGVALTDVRLRAEALAMGIYDGKGVLDTAQKSQAAYNLILKDTKLAQGDVARTSDNFANQMRAVQATVENASATIGQEFIESIGIASDAMGGTDGLVGVIEDAADRTSDLISGINELANELIRLKGLVSGETEASWVDGLRSVGDELAQTVIPGYENFKDILEGVVVIGDIRNRQQESEKMLAGVITSRYQGLADSLRATAVTGDDAASSIGATATSATKAKSEVDKLKESLDRLNGRISIKRQRLNLRKMLADGPGKSGERTVVGPDGKKTTKRFTTSGDRKEFALDVADARIQLADDIFGQGGGSKEAKARARNQFRLGRQNLAGLGLGGYTDGLLSTPDEFRASNARGAGVQRAQGIQNFYQFGDIQVQNIEQAIEQAKRAERLKQLGSGRVAEAARYTAMAS